jgi:molybdate-binding protein/transcriptional regulator with XRE-family HTH domain
MTHSDIADNRVRFYRTQRGWSQAELAIKAGISRTAVTAIEGRRLVPSVAAALALAEALSVTVEELFGKHDASASEPVWAWPCAVSERFWRADVGERSVCYPASSLPMLTPLPDDARLGSPAKPDETLVIACCDPAAGLLASQFACATGMRLLVLPLSSRQALEMLREGMVHMAGLHLETRDTPDRNARVVREFLGSEHQLVRIALWQEGIALAPAARLRSVRAVTKAKLTWVGREAGSGARQCLDRLLGERSAPRRLARNHRGVTEAVQSGWADAGVCVQLASAEAGLDFLPVQEEAYDLCFPTSLADDRRIKAFLGVVRSAAYRKMLGELPGYDNSETGSVRGTN